MREAIERVTERGALLPGLSDQEIANLETSLTMAVPPDVRALLQFSAGLKVKNFETVQFAGYAGFEFTEAFPRSVALVPDRFGNYWIVDINSETGAWGAVFFVCHDPPVVVVQAHDLAEFILQISDFAATEIESALRSIQQDAVDKIWKYDPWLITRDEADKGSDPLLSNFARKLPKDFRVVDLRSLEIGSGFSWGSANGKIIRAEANLIFGVETKPLPLLKRLVTGRKVK